MARDNLIFSLFRLDFANERLWRDTSIIPLRPKTFAVLRYLVERPGQLVSNQELLQAVWPDVVVDEAMPRLCIREIRQALGDAAKQPKFIETQLRRGYRFIAPITTATPPTLGLETRGLGLVPSPPLPDLQAPSPESPIPNAQHSALGTQHSVFVGRDAELAQLHQWWEKARNGERQIIFVTGEVGIGKTTVVEAFLDRLTADERVWIGRGQCIEHYGAGEAYMPVLEALGRLCQGPEGKRFIEILRQRAPTWLVQMLALLSAREQEKLQRQVMGAVRERMLREIAEALEVLTVEKGLVLRFEDLQWSDVSTLDLLAVLARRQERARLLVLGTYRPVDVIVSEHPLKRLKEELQLHECCQELPLEFLTEAAVVEYLAVRFPVGATDWSPLQQLARVIHRRTDGNPLFMVTAVDDLIEQGLVVRVDGRWTLQGKAEEIEVRPPGSIQQLIEQHLERLGPETQRLLEAASVGGVEFSAAAVAAGLGAEVETVEEQCEALVRRQQFLRARRTEEWPDGTVAARYSFLHALHREVLYKRMTARRRIRLHQRIGEREEEGYGERAREIAVELAMHFEQGRDHRRAVQYLTQAGENALRRSASEEAIHHLTKGLELLKALPDTPERTQQELTLQVTLSVSLVMTQGYAAPDVEKAYTRARELCQQVEETPQLFPVLIGLMRFYVLRADFQMAYELGEQLLRLAHRAQDSALSLVAHMMLEATLLFRGEFVPARAHLEQSVALYDPQRHSALASLYGDDPEVNCLSHGAWILWYIGYPDQGLKRIREALTLAQALSHPFSLTFALGCAANLHQFRREGPAAQERIETMITLSEEQEFPHFLAYGTILRGRALAEQGEGEEGIAQIRQGLTVCQAIGQKLGRPYFLALLAEAYGAAGQVREGLNVLSEALDAVNKTGECIHEAELYRLKGELLLQL